MINKMGLTAKIVVPIIGTIVICAGILTFINMRKQKAQALVEVRNQARMAADQLISTRKIIASKQKIINTESDGKFVFKGVAPAIVGREISDEFGKSTIYKMKQTSLKYRNPANKPDAWEVKQLKEFEKNKDLTELSELTKLADGSEAFRLMVPLKISEVCLKCHGDPATSPTGDGKDIAGRQMEHYKLGDIRGAVSVTVPMETVNAALASNIKFNIFGSGIFVLIVSGVVFFVTRRFMSMLKGLIGNVKTGTEGFISTANQISASSQSLAEGATQQASSIEETTATMEEMSSMVKQNADNAREAVQLSNLCNDSAEKGSHAVNETNRAMQEINESSKKIADILKVIDGIAFQTTLLALNAAVEAARAGEHGKGFAVVAEEVRNLAQRSAVAAKDTAALIQDSVQKADNGAKLAQGCGVALQEIVTNVKKVTNLINEIAAASEEQAQGVSQVGQAMQGMDTVTQQNATSAEQTSSATEELFSQAKVLLEQVEKVSSVIGINGNGKLPKAPLQKPELAQARKPLKSKRRGNNGNTMPRMQEDRALVGANNLDDALF